MRAVGAYNIQWGAMLGCWTSLILEWLIYFPNWELKNHQLNSPKITGWCLIFIKRIIEVKLCETFINLPSMEASRVGLFVALGSGEFSRMHMWVKSLRLVRMHSHGLVDFESQFHALFQRVWIKVQDNSSEIQINRCYVSFRFFDIHMLPTEKCVKRLGVWLFSYRVLTIPPLVTGSDRTCYSSGAEHSSKAGVKYIRLFQTRPPISIVKAHQVALPQEAKFVGSSVKPCRSRQLELLGSFPS